jgi:ABC-type dipeptide/oligopeptide/nickel transport system permease component
MKSFMLGMVVLLTFMIIIVLINSSLPGKKPFFNYEQQKEGFTIRYSLATHFDNYSMGDPVFEYYNSFLGNQEGSTIEIIGKQELPPPTNNAYRRLKITMRINCKMYDLNKVYKGDIRDGLIAGEIHIFH